MYKRLACIVRCLQKKRLIVLQHLLIGINTHINLDLGIAAADACPGDKIFDLQSDFEKINSVIASITQAVQDDLSEIWFPLKTLTNITNNSHEAVLNFSISNARKASWANAVALAMVQGKARSNYINMIDNTVVKIIHRIMNPGFATSFILKPVRMMESSDVSKNIDLLVE
jgi:ABC-type ATPase with predicted acetyltransferase domain